MTKPLMIALVLVVVVILGAVTARLTEFNIGQQTGYGPVCVTKTSGPNCKTTNVLKGGATKGVPLPDRKVFLLDGQWETFSTYNYGFGLRGRTINTAIYTAVYCALALGVMLYRNRGSLSMQARLKSRKV